MAINSYGLFNNGQPGGGYNSRNYELQRQLEARQHQLGELDRMPVLSAAQQQKREQLLHAVDHLTGELNPKGEQPDQKSALNGIGRRDTADGIVIPKNEYSNSDVITYKNPRRYDGSATTPGDTYLKGFFVDIKL